MFHTIPAYQIHYLKQDYTPDLSTHFGLKQQQKSNISKIPQSQGFEL